MKNLINKIEKLSPLIYDKNPPFGKVQVPILLSANLSKDNPIPESTIIDYFKPITLDPFSSVLHYGQSIFEGLKAYRLKNGTYGIFRGDLHAARFVKSAKMMSMSNLSVEYVLESLKAFTEAANSYIPELEGHSLYLRPMMMGIDPIIKVKSSDTYKFMIMASIVGNYFQTGSGAIKRSKVLVGPHFVRAFPGGTGEAKTASNYAQSLFALDQAMKLGYEQVLYLDATTKTKFEELGGMNFFWVKNGALYTPKLNGQILHGVTRTSIIEIAKHLGIKVFEEDLYLKDLIQGTKDGSIEEAFATGTAATVSPLGEIGVMNHEDNNITKCEFVSSAVGEKLKNFLESTHRGETEFSHKWLMQ